jgi:drug/metabolite transporter (DMT)-like permease
VFVSLVTNIAPLLVALFSYILYKIALQRLDIINLFVSFAGVALLITGSPDDPATDPSRSALSFNELIIPSILLLTIPIN